MPTLVPTKNSADHISMFCSLSVSLKFWSVEHSPCMVRVSGFVQPGDYLLLRFEDRLMWVYVAEMGNAYIYFCIKVCEMTHALTTCFDYTDPSLGT